ncbi:ComF family protein [Candidatus Roizmanbacteria bacterium]|nr:ComF family protein [Candidatus Roizmanbacteria bacterium]
MIHIIEVAICPVCTRSSIGGATHPGCRNKYTLDGLTSIFRYSGGIQRAIKHLKYRRMTDVISSLVNLTIAQLQNEKERYRYFYTFIQNEKPPIIPIPLHWWRERGRWFNQSELIGQEIAERLQLEFKPDILIRPKFKTPQAGLTRKDRLTNIKGSFTINSNEKLRMTSAILLVDDVWTTGATLREAANILKRAGVKRVWGFTVAR